MHYIAFIQNCADPNLLRRGLLCCFGGHGYGPTTCFLPIQATHPPQASDYSSQASEAPHKSDTNPPSLRSRSGSKLWSFRHLHEECPVEHSDQRHHRQVQDLHRQGHHPYFQAKL